MEKAPFGKFWGIHEISCFVRSTPGGLRNAHHVGTERKVNASLAVPGNHFSQVQLRSATLYQV